MLFRTLNCFRQLPCSQIYQFARIKIAPRKSLSVSPSTIQQDAKIYAEKESNSNTSIQNINSQLKETPQSSNTIRLSKYLSNTGVCSRRQAEKFISQGIVQNVLLDTNNHNDIRIFSKHGEKVPVKQDTKIWLLNKPVGMICSHKDPQKRPSVYDYAQQKLKTKLHIISVGRLDYNSEGLLLLTNDGNLARALELPASNIEREYQVRVYGRFDEQKLIKIQAGVAISGVKYGPFFCVVKKRQTRNTWLIIRMRTGKNREIRKVMQKFSLRVNRLVRTRFGPYQLGNLVAGDIQEVEIHKIIKQKLYLSMRKDLSNQQEILKEKYTSNKQIKEGNLQSATIKKIAQNKPQISRN